MLQTFSAFLANIFLLCKSFFNFLIFTKKEAPLKWFDKLESICYHKYRFWLSLSGGCDMKTKDYLLYAVVILLYGLGMFFLT
ncbi:MAG: hypothetical protein IJ545_03425, partial [Alphaproteobacteria bacterium]|nr:hypothetical protein [Alphaproteobacteria bacterium]